MRQSKEYRTGMAIAGLLAAVAMAVRGVMDLRNGGWVLILVAVAIVAAVAMRRFLFRD